MGKGGGNNRATHSKSESRRVEPPRTRPAIPIKFDTYRVDNDGAASDGAEELQKRSKRTADLAFNGMVLAQQAAVLPQQSAQDRAALTAKAERLKEVFERNISAASIAGGVSDWAERAGKAYSTMYVTRGGSRVRHVAAAALKVDARSVYVGYLSAQAKAHGAGGRAMYEIVKYSIAKGKGGAVSLTSLNSKGTIAFYDRVGFSDAGHAGYRTLSSKNAMKFLESYEKAHGLPRTAT